MAAPLPASISPTPTTADSIRSQSLLAILVLVLFAALMWKAYSPQFQSRPTDRVTVAGKPVNLNSADRNELLQIPGVGPATADAILAHRRQHGRFETLDELDNVHGIGSKTLDKLRPWFTIGPGISTLLNEPVEKLERKAIAPPSSKVTSTTGTININTATAEELQTLPAIGVKRAEYIIAERKLVPFKSIEDLRRINGIGDKSIEKLKPLVRFAD